jgi:HK97 family phage prohead protease
MPITRCDNGKWRIGDGECVFSSEANAARAYSEYLENEEKAETYNDYPEAASNNAKKVLRWREEYGDEVRGMTAVGWNRANQLANKERLSRATIAKMAAFERHRQNAEVAPEFKETPWRDNGHVAWLGWGGSAGIEWAQRKLDQIDNKNKNMGEYQLYKCKNFDLEVKDIDKKSRIVTGYFSTFGNLDSDGDIMMPGAFKRSIQDWGPEGKGRIKHLQNHNTNLPLGRPIVLKEDTMGLYYESKLVETSFGTDFIKMVEGGLITEHSIGFSTIREQKTASGNEIQDVKLFEGSSLTAWGANEDTPMLGFKSVYQVEELKEEIRRFEKFIRHSDATDETIDLCIIKVRQLAQAVEALSTKASDKEPEQQKGDDKQLEMSLISILGNF